MMNRFNNWIDSFIPKHVFGNDEALRIHRLFVGIAFTASFFAFLYSLITVYIHGYGLVVTLSISALVSAILPFLLLRGVRLSILANIFLTMVVLAYCSLLMLDGGIERANVTPWIILFPAAAMMIRGARTALVWMGICMCVIFFFSWLYYRGVHFDTMFDEDKDALYRMLAICGFVGCGYVVIYIFEDAKNAALKKLEEQNKALQNMNREKNNFLALVAHDLKNPLGSTRMFIELASNPATSEEKRQQYLQNIGKTTDRMFELVKNLLDVNLIESGQISLHIDRVNVNELLKEYIHLLGHLAAARKIEIVYELPPHAIYIETDVRRLAQVLENYISNALKYSPPETKITLRLEDTEQYTGISVLDEGEGISMEEISKLFVAFSVTTAQPQDGAHKLGLGLAIVKKLGDELGAETGCRSQKGKGSEFFIRFKKNG